MIAAVAGFVTLLIANFLAGLSDGDTLGVLQAVLDTQFWLATHVVCITLGYATTFVAGLLGMLYILRGVLTPSLSPAVGKDLSRMIYGTLCFAMFFSFVGTVLGGLWADDSWGRFWGWDPKENGALIIVLWNALVLHARWGGMVKDRGLAVLAVVGNIVISLVVVRRQRAGRRPALLRLHRRRALGPGHLHPQPAGHHRLALLPKRCGGAPAPGLAASSRFAFLVALASCQCSIRTSCRSALARCQCHQPCATGIASA